MIKFQIQCCLTRLRRRLEFNQRDAVGANAIGRFARANADQFVLAIVLNVPGRPIRGIDAIGTDGTGARRFAGAVKQAQGDDRPRFAVRNQV
jgi:hypothetical protein